MLPRERPSRSQSRFRNAFDNIQRMVRGERSGHADDAARIAAELGFTILFSWMLFGETYGVVQLAGLGLSLVAVSGYLWMQSRDAPEVAQSS